MRYAASQVENTREQLLVEAERTIRNAGVQAVTLGGVTRRIGKTHGGFYGHFLSRDAMVEMAIERMFKESRGKRERDAVEAASPAEGLVAFVVHYVSPEHRDDRAAGCPLALLAGEAPRLSATARELYAREARSVREFISRPLRARGMPVPDSVASAMLAEMVGAICLARAEPNAAESAAILAAARPALRDLSGLRFP